MTLWGLKPIYYEKSKPCWAVKSPHNETRHVERAKGRECTVRKVDLLREEHRLRRASVLPLQQEVRDGDEQSQG